MDFSFYNEDFRSVYKGCKLLLIKMNYHIVESDSKTGIVKAKTKFRLFKKSNTVEVVLEPVEKRGIKVSVNRQTQGRIGAKEIAEDRKFEDQFLDVLTNYIE